VLALVLPGSSVANTGARNWRRRRDRGLLAWLRVEGFALPKAAGLPRLCRALWRAAGRRVLLWLRGKLVVQLQRFGALAARRPGDRGSNNSRAEARAEAQHRAVGGAAVVVVG